MKKGFLFSFVISFVFILGLIIFPIKPKSNFSHSKIDTFNKFEQSLISELQNDDYTYTEIDKNITLNLLKQQLEPNSNKDNYITTFSIDESKPLTLNQFAEYCSANDLMMKETKTSYLVKNKFALKRLIITGELPSNHKANKVLSIDDMHILCYNTITDTKTAYQQLISQKINVSVDFILSAESEEFVEAQTVLNNWSEKAINLSSYTDYTTAPEVVVAVLDTGINTLHSLFSNRLLKENGKIVGVSYYKSSYDYNNENLQLSSIDKFDSNLSFEDDHGHGTHVSGIIASQTPSNVKILPMRVLDTDGSGAWTAILGALKKIETDYSNKYNIVCNNLSLGGKPTANFESNLNNFNNIFTSLKSKNILSVVAAGNNKNNPLDTKDILPAACGESAIVVSALKLTTSYYSSPNDLAYDGSYSNYGDSVDISAPGTSIYSAYKAEANNSNSSNINKAAYMDGTSQAAPHVSACVALLCLDKDNYNSSTGKLTFLASEIESKIISAAIDLGDKGKDKLYGWGALTYTNIDTLQTIEYTASNTTATYDGNYHNINIVVSKPSNYTITYSLEDDNTYTISDITSNSAFKNATDGAKTIYFKITAPHHKMITGSKTLTINKQSLTYNLENQTSTYGNAVHLDQTKLTKTSGTIATGDNLGLKLNTNATQHSSVGSSYSIYLTHTNNNYSITSNTATLTITKRSLTFSVLDQTSTYGNETHIDASKYILTSGYILPSDNINLSLTTNATQFSNVGNNYNISLTYSNNSNYTINSNIAKLTINPRPATINVDNQTSIYGEKITLDNTKFSTTGIFENDDLNIKISTSAQNTKAKDYSITASYSANDNYTITIKQGVYSVTKRDISIETANQSNYIYGNDIVLNQTMYKLNSGNFAFSDYNSIELTTDANKTSEIGEYDINLTFDAISNYNLTLTKGKAKINPRQLTISLLAQNVQYGDNLTLDKNSYTIVGGNIVNNDSVEINLSSETNPENSEEFIVSAVSSNKNYTIGIQNSQITIIPRKITISTHQFKIYGDEVELNSSDFTIVAGSIVGTDDLQLTLSTNATSTTNIGDYEITLISANKKYEVTLVDSYLTIKPKTIIITLLNQQGIYGDVVKLDNSKYSVDGTQLVEGTNLSIKLSTDANETKNVGNYKITATSTNPNYNIQAAAGTFTILKRKLSIRVYNQTTPHTFNLTYNTEDYDLMAGSVVNGDELNIKLHTNATALSFAGDYDLIATYNNENYDITFTDATLTLEFSYVDALIIVVPALVVILIATIILIIVIKHKNKTNPLYKKWTN